MRQLSKVYFINSANVRYGEVRLDGNVHLIGTQGVGKSTVLRAILFFYTGDKLHLGISREKKSFDDFYLPGANSYLAYQVESECGAFTVLVFRRHAHSVFRFIGAPLRKEWLIDEAGEVTSDASVLRQRLGEVPLTRSVDEYQENRDIIYGNNKAVPKEFARFAVMETAKYQNIPRSLQNVFLGAKVDADFIKDIIIRSLGDEEPGIDLQYFRSQLSGFEREYNDISQWFKKNSQGEVTVRREAERVIALYRRLLYLDDELVRTLLELRYARRYAAERIPLLEKQAEDWEIEQGQYREKLADLQEKYAQELSALEQELGVLKDKLERIPKLRKKYENIQSVIAEDGQEASLQALLTSQKQLRLRLTQEYADISAKYSDRERELRLGFGSWKAARLVRKVEVGEAFNVQTAKAAEALQAALEGIDESFRELEETAEGRLEDLSERIRQADMQLALSAHLYPFVEETEAVKAELSRLSGEEKAMAASEKSAQADLDAAIKESQFHESALIREYEDRMVPIRAQIKELEAQIADIDALLASMEGSFLQWLSQNKPDWTENIGRVADEKTVLYESKLWPRMASGENSFFGVDIDLSCLKSKVRTPGQLMKEKGRLEKGLQELRRADEALVEEKETALAALKKKWNTRIKAFREELSSLQTARLMLPEKIAQAKKQLAAWQEKSLEAREAAQNKYKEELRKLVGERVLATQEMDKLLEEKTLERKKAQEVDGKKRKSLRQQYTEALAAIDREIADRESELQNALQVLSKEQEKELAGQGADTEALRQCEAAIGTLKERLKKIAASKELLVLYRKDKEDYLDKKDIFLSQKQKVESKKTSLSDRYALKKRKEEDALERISEALQTTKEELKTLNEGLKEAENFEQHNALPLLPEGREHKTEKTCRQVMDAIHGALSQQRNTEQEFIQSVNGFTSHFSPGNIFEFKTDNRTDEDYRSFAASLVEFIENDKIEEFRKRTSTHYADLLVRISHEMDEVSRNSSEIAGIVSDINYDFREKNFIGAVKSIELRTVPSADKMVLLLQQIMVFADEHGFDLDGVNLFSGNASEDARIVAKGYLLSLMKLLVGESRTRLTLSDTFQLQFRITENDNDTGWVEKISSVGSEGTDTLVKAMVNIMLINVFKERVSGRFTDFRIHCVMDEIGKLHPRNIKGILDFAGARNIFLVNGSPVPYNVADYKHTYLLSKDGNNTVIRALLSRKEAAGNVVNVPKTGTLDANSRQNAFNVPDSGTLETSDPVTNTSVVRDGLKNLKI